MGIAENAIAAGEAELKRLGMMDSDPVNHPRHYTGFSNGAVVEDLHKAIWYLNRELNRLEGNHE